MFLILQDLSPTGMMLDVSFFKPFNKLKKFFSILNLLSIFCLSRMDMWDFPGDPVTKTPCSQCRRPVFNPCYGTRSHMLQLRPGAAKGTFFFFKENECGLTKGFNTSIKHCNPNCICPNFYSKIYFSAIDTALQLLKIEFSMIKLFHSFAFNLSVVYIQGVILIHSCVLVFYSSDNLLFN